VTSSVSARLARLVATLLRAGDNYNRTSHKCVRVTTYQPNTKSNPNLNRNSKPITKQHAIVSIQLNIVTCPTNPDTFKRDMSLHRLCALSCNCHTATLLLPDKVSIRRVFVMFETQLHSTTHYFRAERVFLFAPATSNHTTALAPRDVSILVIAIRALPKSPI